jgi:hypothetical protein
VALTSCDDGGDDGREISFPTVFIVVRSRALYGELAMSDALLPQLHHTLSLPVFPKGGGTSDMELILGAESSIPAVAVWNITSPTDALLRMRSVGAAWEPRAEVMRTLTVLYIDNGGERNPCIRIVKRGDVSTKDVLRVSDGWWWKGKLARRTHITFIRGREMPRFLYRTALSFGTNYVSLLG